MKYISWDGREYVEQVIDYLETERKEVGMHWNYRLVNHETHVELVEMYYEDDGSFAGYTDALLTAADKEDMQKTLALMHHDVKTKPILQVSELPQGERKG